MLPAGRLRSAKGMIATAGTGMSEAAATKAVAAKVVRRTPAEAAPTATKTAASAAKTPAAATKRSRICSGQQGQTSKDNRHVEDPAGNAVQRRLRCIADLSLHGFASFFIVRKSTRIVPLGIAGSNILAGISLGNFQSEKTAVYCGDWGRLA